MTGWLVDDDEAIAAFNEWLNLRDSRMYRNGMIRARNIIHQNYFGGPTRDMIEGWLNEEIGEEHG